MTNEGGLCRDRGVRTVFKGSAGLGDGVDRLSGWELDHERRLVDAV
jgi:hypothetical protein